MSKLASGRKVTALNESLGRKSGFGLNEGKNMKSSESILMVKRA